ncbi:putative membrane protein YagU involved in acid resistance [Methanohalophilus levihalophilus]|uniref:hypothetical protein n=1 Tax=Methanohalophilus levihalophilus TaxID=1431282 RepID=UPI001AE92405|nr:hypothetical protein [Methanohalophilus levihalophilus]MBP2029563.1 putative membrane protein YagU involved in acid resistance [Methanohalophilus levihalophilus]
MVTQINTNRAPMLSFISAILLSLLFVVLTLVYRNPARSYSEVDIAAGAIFILILSLMIFLLLWPMILEKWFSGKSK